MFRPEAPLLVVDIGNTSVHWAPYCGKWGRNRRLETRAIGSFGAHYDSEIQAERSCGRAWGQPEVALLCSVVPQATERLVAELEQRGMAVLLLGESLQAAMPVFYAEPKSLGQDRLANAVAAYERFRSAAILVDVGTAITVDAVSERGEFLGGAIAPGPREAWEGLKAAVSGPAFARLIMTSLVAAPAADIKPLGQSTEECLAAGLRIGFAGLVDRLVQEQRRLLGKATPVVWTGGEAPLVRAHSQDPGEYDELLTLRGLVSIYRTFASNRCNQEKVG